MPNKRLKLTGPAFRGSVGLRPPALAPQLKRDPLGGTAVTQPGIEKQFEVFVRATL